MWGVTVGTGATPPVGPGSGGVEREVCVCQGVVWGEPQGVAVEHLATPSSFPTGRTCTSYLADPEGLVDSLGRCTGLLPDGTVLARC